MLSEARRVGVVGGDAERVASIVDDAGLAPVVGSTGTVVGADPDVIVALGESAVLTTARERPGVPLLAVAAGAGFRSVPRDDLAAAARHLATGEWTTESHPLVEITGDGHRSLAVMDAMLAATEPAHISEFTVTADGERVARFRADGVVAATPAGTCGYAHAAGAPVIPPGPAMLALVPIAPFATTLDHWVVPADDVAITVERDDATVDVLADDRVVSHAPVGDPIELSADGAVEMVQLPQGRSPFDPQGAELEKL